MTFRVELGALAPRAARLTGLAMLLASCAEPRAFPPPPQGGMADDIQCTSKVEVTAKLVDGTPAQIDPSQLMSLYPDRAYRMMSDGEATYGCRREASNTVCAPQEVAPAGMGFEYVDKPLAKLVAPADGETLTLRLTFRIAEKGRCHYQIAPSAKARR